MASFTERQEHQLEIIPPYSIIQCRRADIIEKDGKEVGKTYHRHSRAPGEDVSDDCAELQAVAAALWTPEVIAAYEASKVPVVQLDEQVVPTETDDLPEVNV